MTNDYNITSKTFQVRIDGAWTTVDESTACRAMGVDSVNCPLAVGENVTRIDGWGITVHIRRSQ